MTIYRYMPVYIFWRQGSATQPLLNPFPNKPWFLRVCNTSLLKTQWEKKKLLVISPLPAMFSTHLEKFLPFLSNLKLSSANSFSLEASTICRLGKG